MSWINGKWEQPEFHDKSWKRADMAAWDQRWAQLPVPARRQYVEKVKAATHVRSRPPFNKISSYDAEIVQQWHKAGLIRDENNGREAGFVVKDEALGFTTRLRHLKRFHMLEPKSTSNIQAYVHQCFASYQLTQICDTIVQQQTGVSRFLVAHEVFETFVTRRRWPDWVAAYLKDPLAKPLIAAIESQGGVVPLARLAEYLPKHQPDAVRETADKLLNHLALFEDIDPQTFDILIGLLPAVREDRRRAAAKPSDYPLKPAAPIEFGPDEGLAVVDLRALLLEAAGQPPRMKQDQSLFQKEEERFLSVFEPSPEWLTGGQAGDIAIHQRLTKILVLARQLDLARDAGGANQSRVLELTEQGRRWLLLAREEQYAFLYSIFRDPKRGERTGSRDAFFLGNSVAVMQSTGNSNQDHDLFYYGHPDAQGRQPLRDALYSTFADLPMNTYFRAEDFLQRYSMTSRNPLLLGRDVVDVIIRLHDRRVLPLEEYVEDAGRRVLWALIETRLIPLGCVQTARDANDKLLLARLPRLDVYFGKAEVAPSTVEETTRVVVQPDFSVIVIGLSPAPAAELAPFCERVRGRSSQGSLTFRITRDSVVRGLMAGLPPEQVMARLEKYASTPIPKNVATEVRGWCGWARTVTPTSALLLRCPDADTAGRVMSALGKLGERIADTVVALDADGVSAALRQKLAGQGIMLEGNNVTRGREMKRKTSRRR